MAGWQRTIHGPETLLRECVTSAILSSGNEKGAARYAMCGLGDRFVKDKGGFHVAPLGCGHRLCPRCGRTKGTPMVRRVLSWLAVVPHGDLFTMCLTQRVIRGESLPAARRRLVAQEQQYIGWLREMGMISGVSVAHPNWSASAGGWHYHVHLVIELPADFRDRRNRPCSTRRLRAMWRLLRWGESVQAKPASASMLAKAGPGDIALLDGSQDPDFWSERSEGLAAAVQYPVRDIAQGVSGARLGGDREQMGRCVTALLVDAKGWKLRRTYGQWRKKPPPRPSAAPAEPERVKPAAEVEAEKHPCCPAGKVINLGTVHRCARLAARGDMLLQLAFTALESSCRNDTDFGRRFVAFCRTAAVRGVT